MIRVEEPECIPYLPGTFRLIGNALGELPVVPQANQPVPFPHGSHLRPIGRLVPFGETAVSAPALQTIKNGQTYRITSAPHRNRVSPALAETIEKVLDQFAVQRGFTSGAPLQVAFGRGYAAGDRGHGSGLALDIASIGGRGLREWKQVWDQAVGRLKEMPDEEARRTALSAEVQRNLGYQLYRALLDHGGWRVFNHVVQLFGPWTDQLGPWRRLRFDAPTDAQNQLMAEQEHIYQAHQDHIHVAMG
jgi:hypothetical protein